MNSHHSHDIARRGFIHTAVVLGAAGLWLPRWARAAALPNFNPTRALRLAWTEKLRWDFAVDITSVAGAGEFWDERLEMATGRKAPSRCRASEEKAFAPDESTPPSWALHRNDCSTSR